MTGVGSSYKTEKPRAGSGAASLKARFEQMAKDDGEVSRKLRNLIGRLHICFNAILSGEIFYLPVIKMLTAYVNKKFLPPKFCVVSLRGAVLVC